MTRIPSVRRWRCTHTWTGTQIEVGAPTRFLAKLNAAHELRMPLSRAGEFTARVLPNPNKGEPK